MECALLKCAEHGYLCPDALRPVSRRYCQGFEKTVLDMPLSKSPESRKR